MFHHPSNIAYTKQESIEFQQLPLSHPNSNSNSVRFVTFIIDSDLCFNVNSVFFPSIFIYLKFTLFQDNIIYGVEIPNRVFVGRVAYDVSTLIAILAQICKIWFVQTTELELKNFFQSFGEVKDAKIITDRDGSSKGYVTLRLRLQFTVYYDHFIHLAMLVLISIVCNLLFLRWLSTNKYFFLY